MYSIRQTDNTLTVIKKGSNPLSIRLQPDYNTDKIFALGFKANNGSVLAERLLDKELASLVPVIPVVDVRLEKRLIKSKIRAVRGLDISTLPITLPEDWNSVMEVLNDEEQLSVKHFLIWLALNDNEYTRNNFLKHFKNSLPYITPNGFIVSVRQVWKRKRRPQDDLYNFIQSALVKVKAWKKANYRFTIWKNEKSEYKLVETDRNVFNPYDEEHIEQHWRLLGDLSVLSDYPAPDEVVTYYSDWSKHNTTIKRESWKLQEVAEIQDKGTHTSICGINQLHIRTNPMECVNSGGYGDTFVITLVNPKDVINIEQGWKYTTSRMYIAAEVSAEEIKEEFVKSFGKFDYDYMHLDLKHLLQLDLNAELRKAEEALVLNNTVNHLTPEVLSNIIKSRMQLI